ncbi:MAG: tol-pal system protein YbgF [Proteobacteria bacterium]|nr:tol-pal system protein YbgF [Pseudomonadota bacterium]
MMRYICLGVALLATGCATTQTGAMTERDRIILEGKVEDLESASTRQKTKITSLEKRVAQLEDMVSMLSRRTSVNAREIVRIEPEGQGVSAQFEHTSESLNDDVYQEIIISEDKKREYFGTSSRSNSSSGSKGPTKAYESVTDERLPSMGDVAAKPVETSSQPLNPMASYQEGIDLYRQGNYADARARFETFLATKPDETYIDNALYWIGECFYGEGLYHEAAGYFHRIVQDYPKANKVPDALLKVSLTYQKLGKLDSASEMLRYLMDAFPGTEAARIGKEKYEAMIHE